MFSIFKSPRVISFFAIAIVLLGIFAGRLFHIQVVDNDYYISESKKGDSYKVVIPANRGEILDRNGNPLVVNRQGYSIILDYAYFPPSDDNAARNAVILNLVNLLESRSEAWINDLPMDVNAAGALEFRADSDREIQKMKSKEMLGLNYYATVENCYQALMEKYGIEGYSLQDAMKIAAVRYKLTLDGFSMSAPVTIAEDVSTETIQIIKQDSTKYKGADSRITAYREYADGTVAPHILGITGKISAEQYQEKKSDGYLMNDIIGQSGIEKAMEQYLRGIPGEMTVTVDDAGDVTKTVTKEPVQGHTIVLTIDKDLQVVAQNELASVARSVASDSAGAVVVENVNTGEILASASYPTYDISKYREEYDKLSKDKTKPLFNRFAQGTYAPGSTFKPAMAVAGLEEGVITPSTTFVCHGSFSYLGSTFGCLDSHGTVNVVRALEKSCNIYFYNTALNLGISKMNQYCTDFGLGQKTGVEIAESKGILAGKAYSDSVGSVWRPGDTVQAGIGQSDNLFTPLQLASYCSTLANGGTRYQSRYVKQILSYDCSEVIVDNQPVVLEQMDISPTTLDTVHSGMRAVASTYTLSNIFKAAGVNVSAKTGTSQVRNPDGTVRNNGFLITFAPSEKPELSVASVIELAGSGTSTASLTAAILSYYYSGSDYMSTPQAYFSVLP